MPMLETQRLRDRCRALEACGLVDIRILLSGAPGATVELVAGEANAMLDAHACGASTPLRFNDSRRHG